MSKAQCEREGIKYYSFEQIMKWAEELKQYAQNVIVIPKIDVVDDIPPDYIIGYSVPTAYGSSEIPFEKVKHRKLFLLGGNPFVQYEYYKAAEGNVVALDNNYIMRISKFGQILAIPPFGKEISVLELLQGYRVPTPFYVAAAINIGIVANLFKLEPVEYIPTEEEIEGRG